MLGRGHAQLKIGEMSIEVISGFIYPHKGRERMPRFCIDKLRGVKTRGPLQLPGWVGVIPSKIRGIIQWDGGMRRGKGGRGGKALGPAPTNTHEMEP